MVQDEVPVVAEAEVEGAAGEEAEVGAVVRGAEMQSPLPIITSPSLF